VTELSGRDFLQAFEYSACDIREDLLRLTAIFETWHFGDGNYPPLAKDELVNLSFEIQPDAMSKCAPPTEGRFEQIRNAEYRFEGTVLKVYEDSNSPLAVIQAGPFKFYIDCCPKELPALREGDGCRGSGHLLLDHYRWVEFRATYEGCPDLLYTSRVSRIRYVKIPEELISRHGQGMAGPASLSEDQYSDAAAIEVQKMEMGDSGGSWGFYLVDFEDSDVGKEPIPLTFRRWTTYVAVNRTFNS
jgi:hypothetical protein